MTTTTVLGHAPWGRTDRAATAGCRVFDDIREVEGDWRTLEASATMAPYARFDWVSAYQASLPEERRRTRVVVRRDPHGVPAFLLPLQLDRRLTVTIARSIGDKHANLTLPVLSRESFEDMTPDAAHELLLEAGRAVGADVLALDHVPASWDGRSNPFAALGQPSASNAWGLPLGADGDATLARSMSADARKKMRNKLRNLEKLGTVQVRRAGTENEVERGLDAFFRQKAARFAQLGISDPFGDEAARRFLRDGACAGLHQGSPAIEVYTLSLDDEIIAVLAGAADPARFSGMVLSFEDGGFARFSPGEMLVTEVVREQCRLGRCFFDLGVGDARYKRSICDEEIALVDIVLPLTPKGQVAARVVSVARDAKRRLKANPAAMRWLGQLRRLRG
jgi:CelD/BcsL family acetyltransferase involved in cellulose biosynthesis